MSEPAFADCAPDPPAPGGTVTCTNFDGSGFIAPPNTPVTVEVLSGATVDGAGVVLSDDGDSRIDDAGSIQSPGGTSIILTNTGADGFKTLSIVPGGSVNNNLFGSGNGTIAILQNGNFNGAITINATGDNQLTLFPGHGIAGVVNMTGATNEIDNAGFFNNGLILDGSVSNSVINRAGAQISNAFTVTGDGANAVHNDGIVNNGLTFNGDGTNNFVNTNRAAISGDIVSNGAAADFIDNAGVINNSVRLSDGEDILLNRSEEDGGAGTVSGTVDLGADNDIFFMEGGRINGQVLFGSGADVGIVEGGVITSTIQAQDGADTFYWSGGQIGGLDMGTGDDNAIFDGLTPDNLKTGLRIDGGTGNDILFWEGTRGGDVARYVNWEDFRLEQGSELTFSNNATLVLGDAGTGTGALSIDSTSTVMAGNGTHTVAPAVAGNPVTVLNSGLIDLSNGGSGTTDRFVVMGHYVGNNGRLGLQTYLGDETSPSDRLVVSGAGASATGSTIISILNVGGPGALTNGDGIQVVEAANGAATAPRAFTLSGPVGAGMFEYELFRGGVSAGSADSWYLRSQLVATPLPPTTPVPLPPLPVTPQKPVPPAVLPQPIEPPDQPDPPPTTPVPTPPGTPPPIPEKPPTVTPETPPIVLPQTPPTSPTPPPGKPPVTSPPTEISPGSPSVPLLRPEVPGDTLAPALAYQMGIDELGTFHERRGDQSLLTQTGLLPTVWARAFGDHRNQTVDQTVQGAGFQLAPSFQGDMWGMQLGVDVLATIDEEGNRFRAGVFYNHAETSGMVSGNVLGGHDLESGRLDLNGNGVGVSLTYLATSGWYLDFVGLSGTLDMHARSLRGLGSHSSGSDLRASLEGGYPIAIAENWRVEPEAQLIVQRVDFDATSDAFSAISFDTPTAVTGRLGARLEGDSVFDVAAAKPFVTADVWHDFSNTAAIVFNDRAIFSEGEHTSLALGAGALLQFAPDFDLYAKGEWRSNLGGQRLTSYGFDAGVRITL